MADYDLVGVSGASHESFQALAIVLQTSERIEYAILVGAPIEDSPIWTHLFVIATESSTSPRFVVVRSGFASGYGGTGPAYTSQAVLLLDSMDVETRGVEVDLETFRRIEDGTASYDELRALHEAPDSGRHGPWDVVREGHWPNRDSQSLWRYWTTVWIPRALVHGEFQEHVAEFERNPHDSFLATTRKLESRLRQKLLLFGAAEAKRLEGRRLVDRAFGKNGRLTWRAPDGEPLDDRERESRRELFAGTLGALRNIAAHDDDHKLDYVNWVRDLVFVSRLMEWVEDAVPVPAAEPSAPKVDA